MQADCYWTSEKDGAGRPYVICMNQGAGDAPAEPAEPAPPGDAATVDDEVAALKRRLRGDAPAPASPVEAPAPSDDDEISDLKSRLRPKR